MDKLTKRRLYVLIRYRWLQFAAAIVLSMLITSGLLDVTVPLIPDRQKLTIEMVSFDADTQAFHKLERSLQKRLGLKKVTLVHDSLKDPMGWQLGWQFFVRQLSDKEGDVFVLPMSRCASVAEQGALLPLENSVNSGVLPAVDEDSAQYTFSDKDGNQHLFALPAELFPLLDSQYGLVDDGSLVVCIPRYCRNLPATLAWVKTLEVKS